MATFRTVRNKAAEVCPLDVLGLELRGFLVHSMLCDESEPRTDVSDRTDLAVTHMCPPIVSGRFRCDVVSHLPITERERRKIQRFVDRFRKEMEANAKQQEMLPSEPRYLIHPERLQPRADNPLWSFSCVGFVVSAYRNGGITILANQRPLKTLADLKLLYPDRAADLDDPLKRAEFLPEGGESWPVALVGYLFNAFHRDDAEVRSIPFQAQVGDEYFPSRRQMTNDK
ncbi:hypothetical protein Poly51_37440 [Rubripirellula tenax]|uniref:Uncharacterized protein n=2 Tax=Rubripirellula tenax TaxID=2528015 RepID=A0A5C6F1N4_9BACT|nr:hypothetical protein Poly51_37440 [Rubripirellula tenax]